jgi:hypothetical protein
MFDFPTVPELQVAAPADENSLQQQVLQLASEFSGLLSFDPATGKPCEREGIVSRNADEFAVVDFQQNVFKYVRKNHVKTDEHWTRNWRRAKLCWE